MSMSGCGLLTNERVVVKPETVYVFESPTFQHCKTRPVPPGPQATEADGRQYTIDLHDWGTDCEAKVNGGRLEAEQRQKEMKDEEGTGVR